MAPPKFQRISTPQVTRFLPLALIATLSTLCVEASMRPMNAEEITDNNESQIEIDVAANIDPEISQTEGIATLVLSQANNEETQLSLIHI